MAWRRSPTLAKRGIDANLRIHLAEFVKIAQSSSAVVAQTSSDTAAAREADLMALMAWYTDWAEAARGVIDRRDQLIRF